MPRPAHIGIGIGIGILLASAAWPCAAGDSVDATTPPIALGPGSVAVDTDRLERMRGGFVLPSGLHEKQTRSSRSGAGNDFSLPLPWCPLHSLWR